MLPPSLIKTLLRDLVRRPWQTGLMVLGVALGVAVVIAIDLANVSASRGFALSTEAVTGRTTHQIVGSSAGFSDEVFRQVRVDWGVRQSAPIVAGTVIAPTLAGQALSVLGVDPTSEAPFRDYFGEDVQFQNSIAVIYTTPNGVLIGPGLAARGLALNARLPVTVNGRPQDVIVVGILQPAETAGSAFDNLLIMDVGHAQDLLGMRGLISRIDLILTDDQTASLSAQLPAGLRLVDASAQRASAASLTAAFQLNLTALSLLALVVGMFLIYNTIMFSVVQRRAVFGILRTLGANEGQVAALILLEAAVVALLGGALGVLLGWLLGQGAVRLVTQTINDLYFVLSVREAGLDLASVARGVGLGLLAALMAAAAPAWEAAQAPPITLTRRSDFEDRSRRLLPWLGLAGLALTGAGGVLLLAVRDLAVSLGAMFLIVVGLALVVPIGTRLLMATLTGPLRSALGVTGQIAARTVTNAISRTGVAIAALMVAISVTIGLTVMIGSFRSTLTNWLDLTLVADLYVTAPAPGGASTLVTLPPDVSERARAVPGVASVQSVRTVQVESTLGQVSLVVADSQERRSISLYRTATGTPDEIWAAVQNGAVLVSEPFAVRYNLPDQGAVVTLRTDQGERDFPVAAVYYDYGAETGRVLMSRPVYESLYTDRGISGLAIYAQPGQDLQALATAVRQALAGDALQVTVNRELRDQALVVFERTFAITDALRLLAVVVAFIGVLSALMALQLERARELATLQALGLNARGLWRLALTETGLMGLTAGLFSLPTGLVLAVVLVYVINIRAFGWTLNLALEPSAFIQALFVSVAAALLAALYPMRRLLRQPIAVALRAE
jgi:putative ABC transport system permease protein